MSDRRFFCGNDPQIFGLRYEI